MIRDRIRRTRDEAHSYWSYFQLVWLVFRHVETVSEIAGQAISETIGPQTNDTQVLVLARFLLVVARIGLTVSLVFYSFGARVHGWPLVLLLSAIGVRFPRFGLPMVLLSDVVMIADGPAMIFIALARTATEVARACVTSPVGWRTAWKNLFVLRQDALRRRDADRITFWHAVADQTNDAATLARTTDWAESRLPADEIDTILLGARVHALAPDADESATKFARRAERWSIDEAPSGRLGEAYQSTASVRRQRQVLFDNVIALIAGLVGAATSTRSLDLSFKVLLALRITGVGARVAHGVLCATLVVLARQPNKRHRAWSVGALSIAALLWHYPVGIVVVVVLLGLESALLWRSNDDFRQARHPTRLRAIVTPDRAWLAVDRWFVRRQARADASLAIASYARLETAFEVRGLGLEASWCSYEIARLQQAQGELQAALDAFRDIETGGDAHLQAHLQLERGRTLWLIGDQDGARDTLVMAVNSFVALKDRRGCAEATNALGVLEAGAGRLRHADRLTRRARDLALQVPDAVLLVVDNELARSEILLAQGRHLEAAEAARDVTAFLEEGRLLPAVARLLEILDAAALADRRFAVLAARALVLRAEALNAAARGPDGERAAKEALGVLASLGAPLETADAQLALAQALTLQGHTGAALSAALSGLAILGVERHRLTTQPSRARWFERHHAVLELSLDLAIAMSDHRMVAELIEVTRTQAVPSTPGLATTVALTTPALLEVELSAAGEYRSLAGASFALEAMGELPLLPPPVIRVRRTSALGQHRGRRQDGDVIIDIEDAVRDAGGPGAWWLGYWCGSKALYWALLPNAGEPSSGRTPLGPEDPLTAVLGELAMAVPISLAGESDEMRSSRVDAGPLGDLRPKDASRLRESGFANRLGRALIPRALWLAAFDRQAAGEDPLPLVISPCAELASVPWALLGAKPASTDGIRFHDLMDWRLIPSSALMHVISGRPRPGMSPPVTAAIVDPIGDLVAARVVLKNLPTGTLVMTGRWDVDDHKSGRSILASYPNICQGLRVVGSGSTLLIAAHCQNPSTERPSSSGVLIAADDPGQSDWLSARDLLLGRSAASGQIDKVLLPERVIVSACDSAGASTARFGEWLSFGPAVLFAGAQAAVVTQFPVVADATIDEALVGCLDGTTTLASALRIVVSDELQKWRQGHGIRPLVWSGYALLGRFEEAR